MTLLELCLGFEGEDGEGEMGAHSPPAQRNRPLTLQTAARGHLLYSRWCVSQPQLVPAIISPYPQDSTAEQSSLDGTGP